MRFLVSSLVLVALIATGSLPAGAAQSRPNILVIWGDDIGVHNISAYNLGVMGYQTPNIDRIAHEGAMFTDWYGQQSCTAGRAAFITGQSPIRTGLTKVGLPRSMPYFYGSLKVAITLAFVGTTVSEMTAANEGIGYLLISAGSAMQMGLAFAGLVVVGAMAMVMYELFSYVEKHTTAWAHRGSQGE